MHIPERDKLIFTRNVAVMTKSGIPLLEAVRSQASQAAHPSFRKVIGSMVRDIEAGRRFSLALERHPSVFSPFYVNAVRAGEKAGSLEQNLEYIALQIEASMAFKKALTSALLYPAFLLVAVFSVGFAVAYFILPAIADLLTSFESEPPFATNIILLVSFAVREYAVFFLLGAVAAVACGLLLAQGKGGKAAIDRIALHVPVLGNILRQAHLVETATVLSTLLKSGVPVHESLEVTAQSLGNSVYRKAVEKMIPPVLKGNPLSAFLDRRLFPPLFVQMVEVGEKSARIEQNLDFIASFYQKEVEQSLKNILTLLEPVLLIIVGAAVLLLALAIFGPLYQVAGS